MANRKAPVIEMDDENEIDEELDELSERMDEISQNFDEMTFAVPQKTEKTEGPRVRIFLPALEDPGDGGIKVDQYEHVTIANEMKETCYKVHRGEWVEVPVSVYIVLKGKYPNI